MVNCAVVGCTSNSSRGGRVSYHKFPSEERNPIVREAWMKVIVKDEEASRRAFHLRKDSHVCSDHFTADDYEFSVKFLLTHFPNMRTNRLLKKDAVPSRNLNLERKLLNSLKPVRPRSVESLPVETSRITSFPAQTSRDKMLVQTPSVNSLPNQTSSIKTVPTQSSKISPVQVVRAKPWPAKVSSRVTLPVQTSAAKTLPLKIVDISHLPPTTSSHITVPVQTMNTFPARTLSAKTSPIKSSVKKSGVKLTYSGSTEGNIKGKYHMTPQSSNKMANCVKMLKKRKVEDLNTTNYAHAQPSTCSLDKQPTTESPGQRLVCLSSTSPSKSRTDVLENGSGQVVPKVNPKRRIITKNAAPSKKWKLMTELRTNSGSDHPMSKQKLIWNSQKGAWNFRTMKILREFPMQSRYSSHTKDDSAGNDSSQNTSVEIESNKASMMKKSSIETTSSQLLIQPESIILKPNAEDTEEVDIKPEPSDPLSDKVEIEPPNYDDVAVACPLSPSLAYASDKYTIEDQWSDQLKTELYAIKPEPADGSEMENEDQNKRKSPIDSERRNICHDDRFIHQDDIKPDLEDNPFPDSISVPLLESDVNIAFRATENAATQCAMGDETYTKALQAPQNSDDFPTQNPQIRLRNLTELTRKSEKMTDVGIQCEMGREIYKNISIY